MAQAYVENARLLKEQMDKDKETVAMVEAAGGIKTTVTQSDKLGYDWENFFVNDVLVKQTYVQQENPAGTEDNPIVWNETLKLIPNAYYTHDGIRQVWTGEAGVTATWSDPNWVEF